MPPHTPFKIVVDALLDESSMFPPRHLQRFSDLPPADLKSLLSAWPQVSPVRKQALLDDLEELAEADTLVSFDDLARALLADPLPAVRIGALRLLWDCDDPRLLPVFLDMLRLDQEAEVRAAAAANLGHFVYLGELEKIPPDYMEGLDQTLIQVVQSTQPQSVRQRALESLGYSGHEQVAALIEGAYHHANPDWKVSALCAMGRSSDPRWSKQVLSQLHAPDELVRTEAIRAAGELELSTARNILLDLLPDEEDLEVRKEIVWALSKIGGEGVRARLVELLEGEPDDEEEEFLEEALDNLAFTEDMARFNLFDFDADADREAE
jgi:HEAT repeat protein